MTRTKLTFVVVLFAVALGTPVVGADGEGIHISEVNVTPETPEVDESVTVTATVKNDGNERFDLSQVRLIRWDESETVTATNLGTVSPDEEIEVPLTVSFSSEGTKEFVVRASGRSSSIGSVEYPVTVEVGGSQANVDTDVGEAAAGAWVPLDVEVSNGGNDEIRNVRVEASGYGVETQEGGFVSNVSAGGTETVRLYVMSDTEGEETVTTSVRYTNSDGNSLTVERDETVWFEERDHELRLQAETSEDGIEATVVNVGNAAVQDVLVEGGAEVVPVEIEYVDPKSSETVELNVTGVQEERDIDLSASYDLGDERRNADATVGYAPESDVRLTGVSVNGAGTVTITGSASNVGVEDADSVLLAVEDTEGVEPAPPQSDYFVGTVPASDFGTFELNAQVTGNVSEIPVEVRYVSDGERFERTEYVSYGDDGGFGGAAAGPNEAEIPEDDGGLPTWVIAALIVGVVAVMAYGWRKRE